MNKKLPIIPFLILGILLMVHPVGAQKSSLVVSELTVPSGEFTVGDPIKLRLDVTHPADYQIVMPELGVDWGDFTVISQEPPSTMTNEDGAETTSQIIDVRLFAPGTFTTTPLPIKVIDSSGQVSEVITEPISVNISSVLVEGNAKLRDIKPQFDLPYVNSLPWILGLLLAIGIAGGLYWAIRRRKARLALAAMDNRLPHEVALDELARVQNLGLPELGRFKEHYTLISDCMRLYMEKRYRLPMLERTTSEIQIALKGSTLSHNLAGQYIKLLDTSDLVKFSKFRPNTTDAHAALVIARELVKGTIAVVTGDQPESRTNDSSGTYESTALGTTVKGQLIDLSPNGKAKHKELGS